MDGDNSVAGWLEQLKTGTPSQAQQDIWDRYFGRLVALARTKLRDTPAGWHDEEDVALSAMKSFFIRAREDRFPDLQDSSNLWPLLVTITMRKVLNAKRHQFAEKRDARRTENIEDLLGNEPTEVMADEVLDTGNRLLESLPNDQLRRIAAMKLEGYTNKEIAESMGRSHKTVEWKLRIIREQMSRTLAESDDQSV